MKKKHKKRIKKAHMLYKQLGKAIYKDYRKKRIDIKRLKGLFRELDKVLGNKPQKLTQPEPEGNKLKAVHLVTEENKLKAAHLVTEENKHKTIQQDTDSRKIHQKNENGFFSYLLCSRCGTRNHQNAIRCSQCGRTL